MNPLKKIKLKSMLRNCDYLLAGTVIKQQYYDHHRRVEVNHLIDQFMADPGFEHALKLIEFNDMMVFYFTESCKGGLYVRKTELSEHTDHGAGRQSRETDRESRVELDHQPIQSTGRQNGERVLSGPQLDQQGYAGTTVVTAEPEERSTAVLEPSVAELEKSRQLQQLKESEEWMNQMIAKKPRFTPSEITATPRETYGEPPEASFTNFISEPYIEPVGEYFAEGEPLSEPYINSPRKPLGASLDELFGKAAENPQPLGESLDEFFSKPMGSDEIHPKEKTHENPAEKPFINPLDPPSKTLYETNSTTVLIEKKETTVLIYNEAAPAREESRAPDPEPLIVNQRSYPNVIATLQIDLFTLTKQLEEFRRNRSFLTTDERQLKAKIKAFEEAISEFSDAIELLEQRN